MLLNRGGGEVKDKFVLFKKIQEIENADGFHSFKRLLLTLLTFRPSVDSFQTMLQPFRALGYLFSFVYFLIF